jgi:hypothetical protein
MEPVPTGDTLDGIVILTHPALQIQRALVMLVLTEGEMRDFISIWILE